MDALPPGPRMPAALQTVGWVTRPTAFLERCAVRHGVPYTLRLLGAPPFVMFADPEQIKEILTAPPDVLHPGEGSRLLEPVIGSHSVLLLDGDAHLRQRRLMLPAFHGEAMSRLAGMVARVAEQEIASWPPDRPVALHRRLQGLTLEIILRAIFGTEPGPRHEALRERLVPILDIGGGPTMFIPALQHRFGGRGPWARLQRLRAETDALLHELIAERRPAGEGRDDVLTMLLGARHEDGTPITTDEVRDELMTLLVAGHETTASGLAWAFERLTRAPAVLGQLTSELRAGGGDAYLVATVQEVLRTRPVVPIAMPRLVKQPVQIGGRTYPAGVSLAVNAHLVHHDPAIYPEPYAFRPDRFIEQPPGTYTWLPFGGGRRRCLGASFALLEMNAVLRAALERFDVEPAAAAPERARRRAVTISPGAGGRVVLRPRRLVASPAVPA